MEFNISNFSTSSLPQGCDNMKALLKQEIFHYNTTQKWIILAFSTLALLFFLFQPYADKHLENRTLYEIYDWTSFILQKGFLLYMVIITLQMMFL